MPNIHQVGYLGEIMDVKCPTCEKIHKIRIDWRGNGMPRVRCTDCKSCVVNHQHGNPVTLERILKKVKEKELA